MNISGFVSILPILAQGMLGVFFVIGIVWAAIALMVRLK
jgi:hypothetical protein